MTTNANTIRIVANLIQLVGYFLILHGGGMVGVAIKALSDLMIMYWGYKNNMWDVVGVTGIFGLMNIEKLVELLFF